MESIFVWEGQTRYEGNPKELGSELTREIFYDYGVASRAHLAFVVIDLKWDLSTWFSIFKQPRIFTLVEAQSWQRAGFIRFTRLWFCQVSFKIERKGNGVKNICEQMNTIIGHRNEDGCREERTFKNTVEDREEGAGWFWGFLEGRDCWNWGNRGVSGEVRLCTKLRLWVSWNFEKWQDLSVT